MLSGLLAIQTVSLLSWNHFPVECTSLALKQSWGISACALGLCSCSGIQGTFAVIIGCCWVIFSFWFPVAPRLGPAGLLTWPDVPVPCCCVFWHCSQFVVFPWLCVLQATSLHIGGAFKLGSTSCMMVKKSGMLWNLQIYWILVIPWRIAAGFFFCAKAELLLLCDCIAFGWNFGCALVMVTNHWLWM